MKKEKQNINIDNLDNILAELFSLRRFGIKPGLERITAILDKHGNPHKAIKTVHISGTNGKGTVSSMLASILIEAGYSTGLYTSPHLVKFNERIQINGKMIPDDDLKRVAEKYLPEAHESKATFFELTTAMAFDYFAEKKVDIAIIEAGMGGRYDATNVVEPLLSVITSIGTDHKKYLGESIEEIAEEKAGIIKKNTPVVVFNNEEIFRKIFELKAGEMNTATVYAKEYPRPKIIKHTHSLNRVVEFEFGGETFSVHYRLPGEHQIENLQLVIAAIDNLSKQLEVRGPDIEAGVEYLRDNVFFQSRMQYIRKNPPAILDGAHNPESIKALVNTLSNSNLYRNTKFNILFAAMNDKEILPMLEELKTIGNKFIFTVPGTDRATNIADYERIAQKIDIDFISFEDVIDAYIYANKLNEPLLITGSFYLAGEVLKYLKY